VKPDIDSLLKSLRDSATDHPQMPQLEQLLWQRLEAGESPTLWGRFSLPLRVSAVVGAFVWGILIGLYVSSAPESLHSGALLVEQAEFLAPFADDSTR
jgi:hypothetical protein